MKDGFAYIRIGHFTERTNEELVPILEDIKKQVLPGIILDLRSNPGGLLSGVIDISDFFLSKGPIVSTRSRVASENHVFYASSRNTIVPADLPIVVLIDRGSASASEILAGALQDTGRATIMGEKSYGKGSVQQIKRVGDAGFRLTMSRYYTPLGKNIDKIGISPDLPVQEPEFSEEQEQALSQIIEEELIKSFLNRYPNPTDRNIDEFERELEAKGITPTAGLLAHIAVSKFADGLPTRSIEELKECPYEDLVQPKRVHLDSYGNVQICQGISMGNCWKTPLSELVREYDARNHPICGPLVRGGPASGGRVAAGESERSRTAGASGPRRTRSPIRRWSRSACRCSSCPDRR